LKYIKSFIVRKELELFSPATAMAATATDAATVAMAAGTARGRLRPPATAMAATAAATAATAVTATAVRF